MIIQMDNGQTFVASVALVPGPLLWLIVGGGVALLVLVWQLGRQRLQPLRYAATALLCLYLALLAEVTLFPIRLFAWGAPVYARGLGHQVGGSNLALGRLWDYNADQIVGNLIMLAPLAFFLALLWARLARWQTNLAACFAASLAIELLQLVMNVTYLGNRAFDVNDLLLNTLGSLAGYVAYRLLALGWPRLVAGVRRKA
ncbi:VanZ family protein [Lacticaseibacillus suihuaensis]